MALTGSPARSTTSETMSTWVRPSRATLVHGLDVEGDAQRATDGEDPGEQGLVPDDAEPVAVDLCGGVQPGTGVTQRACPV